MPELDELRGEITSLAQEIGRRASKFTTLDAYATSDAAIPDVISQAKMTKAYRMLMPAASAPWGALVTSSKLDRLEPSGIRDQDKDAAGAVWGIWQENNMDSESKLAHDAALLSGRAYALVWPDENGRVEISLDSPEQMVVKFREGSRRHRTAALRMWTEGKRTRANLYRPDGIYKVQGPPDVTNISADGWEFVPDEPFVENPLGIVPVVELRVNGRLKPGPFPYARGEFEHCTGLIDRINLLTFLGLVVAMYMGFPLRGLLGAKINRRVLTDDDGQPLLDENEKPKTEAVPPFDAHVGGVFQNEDPNAKIAEFAAADRKNLSIFAELDQLATITSTPRHYFPLEQGMSNLSADAIRASEGSLAAAVTGHKGSLGDGWEEVLRLAGLMHEDEIKLSPRAELTWKDHEARSMAERADAAIKLKDILPWQVIAERFLNATEDEISRWEGMRSGDALAQLMAAAQTPALPAPTPEPQPVA